MDGYEIDEKNYICNETEYPGEARQAPPVFQVGPPGGGGVGDAAVHSGGVRIAVGGYGWYLLNKINIDDDNGSLPSDFSYPEGEGPESIPDISFDSDPYENATTVADDSGDGRHRGREPTSC